MSLGGAERAGLVGGILLLGALLAAALVNFLPPGSEPTDRGEERDSTTVAPPEPEPPTDPAAGPSVPRDAPEAYFRERERLRSRIAELEREVSLLKARLEEAGIPLEEPPPEPEVVAKSAIAELRLCGPETDPRDVDELLDRIVEAGAGAVETVKAFLAKEEDVTYADAWTFLGGRFVGFPKLRIALMDALGDIGGVEGQSALLTVLSETRDPLEICFLMLRLEDLREGVPAVRDACEEAARRYLELTPFRGESLLVRPVLETLRSQAPDRAAESLLTFARSGQRRSEQVVSCLTMLAGLPEEVAVPALLEIAADPVLGQKSERAAMLLAESDHGSALEAVGRLLAAGKTEAAVRAEVYRNIDLPVSRDLERLARRNLPEGLDTLAEVERILAEIDARRRFLLEREEEEPDAVLRKILTASLEKLDRYGKRAGALKKRIEEK
jgi:hypothetical protein